jgi:biotin carboxyl carrier protein
MAELISPTRGTAGDGGREAAPVAAHAADPRAVRVRLADTGQAGEEAVLRVSPARTTTAGDDGATTAGDGGAGVRAQRHPVEVDGEPADLVLRPLGSGRFVLAEDGIGARVVLEPAVPGGGGTRRREVLVDGFRFVVETESDRLAALRERASRGRAAGVRSGPLEVKAIIPGKVAAVLVAAGDSVTAGERLLVIEAMKMQNELRAPRDGTIARVNVAPGENIDVGDVLLVIS